MHEPKSLNKTKVTFVKREKKKSAKEDGAQKNMHLIHTFHKLVLGTAISSDLLYQQYLTGTFDVQMLLQKDDQGNHVQKACM